jgi:ankyrin repeat protein
MRALRSKALVALGVVALLAAAPAPDAPVADAAMRGDVEAVKELIKRGADVNAAQGDGMTALHWAGVVDNAEMVAVLVKAGAKLETGTRVGSHTPLQVAAREGSAAAVKALLDAGASVAARSTNGVTALHEAAMGGNVTVVGLLISAGADVNAAEPAYGQTPLMLAAAKGRTEAVKMLVERGANVGAVAKEVNLVERAAADGKARTARRQVLEQFRSQSPNPLTWQPTPTQVAAAVKATHEAENQVASTEAVEAANANYQGGNDESNPGFAAMVVVQGGLTPLLFAVREGHTATVDALLVGGADVNQARPGDGTTPVLLAAINGHWDLVLHLLEKGADIKQASVHGTTPLYAVINKQWAPRSRMPQPTYHLQQKATYLEVMEALLKAGSDPNARLTQSLWYTTYDRDNIGMDYTGATPLWRAAYGTDADAIALLVKYGADPSIPTTKPAGGRGFRGGRGGEVRTDPSGLAPVPVGGVATPVLVAAAGARYGRGFAANDHEHKPDGWLPTVKYLVEELSADVNARDADGYNAVHYAAARGDNEMILYLVSKGADVMAVARNGQTTVDMANGPVQRYSPFPETIALLEKMGAKNNHKCVSC